ncbi:hypothetical protein D3C80_1661130 [compost metagenome]
MLEHLGTEFMAEYHRIALRREVLVESDPSQQLFHVIAVLTHMQIGAADATAQHFE